MTYQIAAPLLDACVLGIVDKEDAYGYTLTQRARELIDISESTLYPVLRRLQKSGYLVTYDIPYQGRNRRYYSITVEGRTVLRFYRDEWEKFKENVDNLIDADQANATEAFEQADQADVKAAFERIDGQCEKESGGEIGGSNE